MSPSPSHTIYATVMARAIVSRPPPGGGISFGNTSDYPSYKRSLRKQRERFLHEIIRKHIEDCVRHRHCAALVGCEYRGRLVDLHNVCRIRGSMGRVGVCCLFASSAVRVIGSESHVALDLVFFKHQGKRRLIAARSPLRVIRRHPPQRFTATRSTLLVALVTLCSLGIGGQLCGRAPHSPAAV